MNKIIQINMVGEDNPGIIEQFAELLARFNVTILDIRQSVIHDALTFGLMVEVPAQGQHEVLNVELRVLAQQLGLQLQITSVPPVEYDEWAAEGGQAHHIVTLVGDAIEAKHIYRVAQVVRAQGLNIEDINRLSGRLSRHMAAPSAYTSMEFLLSGPALDAVLMHREFLQLGQKLNIDIAVQEDNIFRKNRRLICFDMDSTLIQVEVIDELAAAAGVRDKVSAITESAMRGEIDFNESFRQRMAELKGIDESVLETIAAQLPITPGAEKLIRTLKQLGYYVVILSGGFNYFARHLQNVLGIDEVHANELEIINGKVTGQVTGVIVDGARKAELLREIAVRESIRLEQVIAVGDGANDLPMLSIAGLGVAFHAKSLVRGQARHALGSVGLDGILYLMGMRDQDFEHLQRPL